MRVKRTVCTDGDICRCGGVSIPDHGGEVGDRYGRGKLVIEHNGALECLLRRSWLLDRAPHFHTSITERDLERCLCNMRGCPFAKVPFSNYQVGEASTEASGDQSPTFPTSAGLSIGQHGIRQMTWGDRVEGGRARGNRGRKTYRSLKSYQVTNWDTAFRVAVEFDDDDEATGLVCRPKTRRFAGTASLVLYYPCSQLVVGPRRQHEAKLLSVGGPETSES